MVLGKRKRTSNGRRPAAKRRRFFFMQNSTLVPRRIRQKVHNFTRSQYISAITQNPQTAVAMAFNFKLSDLTNYSEFTNLYDQYRIKAVAFEILPNVTGNDGNPNTSQILLPFIHTAIDHNDSSAPTIDAIMQYKNYKRTRSHLVHRRYFKPAVASMNYNTVTTTSYTARFGQWIDTDDAATPHYGLKLFIDAPGPNQTLYYRVFVKYYLQFKDQR